jgi:hypothetical protein
MTDADWNDSNLRALAILMNAGVSSKEIVSGGDLLIVFNADDAATAMTLPDALHGEAWAVLFDTMEEIQRPTELVLRCNETLPIGPRSTVLLESRATSRGDHTGDSSGTGSPD